MRKSTTPFLIISFFFLMSCGVNPVKDLSRSDVISKNIANPYFSNPKTDYVYRARITVYGNELGGIFIAKKISDTIHRLVLTTDFGNKLIDVEIGKKSFKVNAIVDELDRKILINTLREDFSLLLQEEFAISAQFKDGDQDIYESVSGKSIYYLYKDPKHRLFRLSKGSKRKRKITIHYKPENDIFAQNIIIQHDNIKLKIELNALKQ